MKGKTSVNNTLILVALAVTLLSFLTGTSLVNEKQPDYDLRYLDSDDQHEGQLHQYRRIKDSMQMIEDCQDAQLSNIGTAKFLGPIAVNKIQPPLPCYPGDTADRPNENSYYFGLANYDLSPASAFFMRGNKCILKSAREVNSTNGEGYISYETNEVRVRYVRPNPRLQTAGYVLIPLSKGLYQVLSVLLLIIIIAVDLLCLYYVIIRPLVTIANIAKGRVFSHVNTRNLRVAGWILVGFVIIPILLQLVFHLAFASRIPPAMHLAFPGILLQERGVMVVGLIMLLLANSFQKGHRLQQDQSLII